MTLIGSDNVERFRVLLPPDVQYVKYRTALMETYYFFIHNGMYVTIHYADMIRCWGAWETTAKEAVAAELDLSLGQVHDGEVNDVNGDNETRVMFPHESKVGGDSAHGLLAAAWDIVSSIKDRSTRPKLRVVATDVLLEVLQLATDAGVQIPSHVQRAVDILQL